MFTFELEEKYYLTFSEMKIYNFIKYYINKNGYSPSLKEISEECNTSISWAHTVVNRLTDKGYISHVPNKFRTITIN